MLLNEVVLGKEQKLLTGDQTLTEVIHSLALLFGASF